MEAVETQQRTVDSALQRLHAHTRDLDALVRDEIRRTLIAMLQEFMNEAAGAAQTMKEVRKRFSFKAAVLGVAIATLGTTLPACIGMWLLPSQREIASLRAQHGELARNIEELRRQGAGVEWTRCGDSRRLCMHIDRSAPVFGEHGEFVVPKGY
jgi:hypothetical protein